MTNRTAEPTTPASHHVGSTVHTNAWGEPENVEGCAGCAYRIAHAEWVAAVDARARHDAEVGEFWSRTNCGEWAAAPVRRSQGAKRAHLTRAIIVVEKAIDAIIAE